MLGLPTSEYVEVRDGFYHLAGSRVGLDVLVHDFRRGKTPEAILQSYPSIAPLGRVYGVIAFILEHPEAIDSYMREQDTRWDKFREEHPLPDQMLDNFRRNEEERARRSA
jgi:hypothetical protein